MAMLDVDHNTMG